MKRYVPGSAHRPLAHSGFGGHQAHVDIAHELLDVQQDQHALAHRAQAQDAAAVDGAFDIGRRTHGIGGQAPSHR